MKSFALPDYNKEWALKTDPSHTGADALFQQVSVYQFNVHLRNLHQQREDIKLQRKKCMQYSGQSTSMNQEVGC